MNLRNLVNKDSTLEDLDALAKTPFKIDGVDYLLVGNLEELVKEARGKKEGDSHAAIVGTRVFFVWLYNHLNLQREFNEEENQTYRTIMAANVKRADKRFEYEQNLRRFKEPEKLFHEMMDPVNDECISALRILNGRFPLRFSELLKAEEIVADTNSVTGSPTLVINGVMVQGDRSSEGFKKSICSAFETVPAECDKTLSSTTAPATGGCAPAPAN